MLEVGRSRLSGEGLMMVLGIRYKAYSLYRTDQSTGRPCLLREARILAGAPQDEAVTSFDVSKDLTVSWWGSRLESLLLLVYRS